MSYQEVCEWTRLFDLIQNRVSIINQVLGARYDKCADNPMHVRHRRGDYWCELCGEVFCTWRLYDFDTTRAAFASVEALNEGIWLMCRSGRMTFTFPQPTVTLY